MDYKRFGSKIILRLDDGDEVTSALKKVCENEKICSGSVHGIGATEQLKTRVYDNKSSNFIYKEFDNFMEITSLTGNITMNGEELFMHLHITAADASMNIVGGHMETCVISKTAEVFLEVLDGVVQRSESDGQLFGMLSFD